MAKELAALLPKSSTAEDIRAMVSAALKATHLPPSTGTSNTDVVDSMKNAFLEIQKGEADRQENVISLTALAAV